MTTLASSSTSVSLLQRQVWTDKMDDLEDLQSTHGGDYRPFNPRKKLVRSASSASDSSSASTGSVIHLSSTPHGSSTASGPKGVPAESKAVQDLESPSRKTKSRDMKPADWGKGLKPERSGPERSRTSGGSGPSAIRSDASNGPRSSNLSAELLPQTRVNSSLGKSNQSNGFNDTSIVLVLAPDNATFEKKTITIPFQPDLVKIGRMTNPKTQPTPVNAYFDSKVLSRQHAELTAERSGRILIKDIKSSNGTFVNSKRLSQENKESDWHEIKTGDLLELGIDIVSEDQKTIVHHKVGAKVEHAGFYSLKDGRFSEVDPSNDSSMSAQYTAGQSLSRPGSQASNRSANSSATFYASQQPAMPAKQQNFWIHPITMEQIVKTLRSEIESQEKYAVELNKANSSLDAISKQRDPSDCSEPSAEVTDSSKSGIPKSKKSEIKMARFTDPPAPPPQMPLPEKPDAAGQPVNGASNSPSIQRSGTAKHPTATPDSVVDAEEGSDLVSMVRALSSAKKEIEAQTARVKDLELRLDEERDARERAERRAEAEAEIFASKMLQDAMEPIVRNIDPKSSSKSAASSAGVMQDPATNHSMEITPSDRADTDGSVELLKVINARLEDKVQELAREMETMRSLLAKYQRRAEISDEKSKKSDLKLAEMVEEIQLKQSKRNSKSRRSGEQEEEDVGHVLIRSRQSSPSKKSTNGHVLANGSAAFRGSSPDDLKSPRSNSHTNMLTMSSDTIEEARLRGALAAALARQSDRHGQLLQAAPYASMLGVVLMGVGLMAFLNGWQRPEH